jgi:LacI family transcriptional regulator
MAAAGCEIDPRWVVSGPPTLAGGRRAVEELLATSGEGARPTALFVASLLGAIGVLSGLRDAAIDVPSAMSVICFNDHELAGHLDPPLTTVRMPNFAMGTEAVRLLLEAIGGGAARDLMLADAPEIVVRGSTSRA